MPLLLLDSISQLQNFIAELLLVKINSEIQLSSPRLDH